MLTLGLALPVACLVPAPRVCGAGATGRNTPPVARAAGRTAGASRNRIQFDGTGSSDAESAIVSDTWTFGDGSSDGGQTLSFPNGAVTQYGYDAEGMSRLVTLDVQHGATVVASLEYAYDDAGNRTRKQVDALAEDYGYDALDRLRSVQRARGWRAASATTRWATARATTRTAACAARATTRATG